MRKYGKWLLVLGVLASSQATASADGFLGPRLRTPFSGAAQKEQNQAQANQIIAAMKDASIQGSGVSVEVQNGVAVLEGKVFKASDRALAQRLAQTVAGVESVENNLRFTADAQGTVQQASATKNAELFEAQISRAGHAESASGGSRIRQVSGETPQVQSAAVLPAVPAVSARPAVDNQAVAQQISETLEGVGLVGYAIEIRYNAGVATLIGDVSTLQQRQAAGATVSQINGVKSVNNQLRVAGPVTQTGYNPQMAQGMGMQQQYAPQMMPAGYSQPGMMADPSMPPSPSGYAPTSFNNPQLPGHAWPAYAQYPNSAAVSYPTQYSASAFPYIGPFYPYPQVPMGWREVSLEWDDGYWQLNFNKEKDKWYWILHPKNW